MSIAEDVFEEVKPKIVRPNLSVGLMLGIVAILLDVIEYYALFFYSDPYVLITYLNIIMPLFGAVAVWLIKSYDKNWKVFLSLWFMEGSLVLGMLLPFGIIAGAWILYRAIAVKEIKKGE
ncbi:MAG: hypothetical protein Q6363_000795 [Candidatus Njordarchaeota archaeon]